MTKPLHTAAPWGVDHFNEHCAFYSPTVEGDYFMRVEFSDDMPESEIAPNISLIGAAPDLLAALEELVERDRSEALSCGFTEDELSWLEEAQRAIANAKGIRT
jgi:hypothetical protein